MSEVLWILPEVDESLVQNLAREARVSETVARMLVNRGIVTAEDAHAFLNPSMDQLHDPMLLPDMEAGVERVAKALEAGEKILVHGDYDVDGVTSAAVLIRTLTRLGGNVLHRVPHRKNDGYDIKPYNADEANAEGVTLIVTADCGVKACETIEHAQSLGIDMVVTDHHEQGEDLPQAVAVINPMRHDSTYPFPHLAGVGVALKFAQALVRRMGHDEHKFLEHFLDLAALGTIADVMPLVGENRVIVKFGLEALSKTKKTGIQAIFARNGLEGKKISTYHVGFVIAPRINAVGRLDDAAIALQLLLTYDRDEADALAEVLEQRNVERQAEQARILESVEAKMDGKDLDFYKAIVLAATDWHSGVVGIVASKVVDRYCRPAILLTINEEEGTAHGSGRSIEAFNMIDALNQCQALLRRSGGHALAAGLSLSMENLADFEEKLNQIATEIIRPEDMIPRITAEGELDPREVSWELLHDINRLEPFGNGNPEPVFCSSGVEVIDTNRVGGEGAHLKMKLRVESDRLDCIGFGMGELQPAVQLGRSVDLCYNIRSNSYNGYDNLQLMIRDIRTEGTEG
jgi:single-stranded-DNA-specific exonuclease